MCVCVHTYICMYVNTHIQREREAGRGKERERGRRINSKPVIHSLGVEGKE